MGIENYNTSPASNGSVLATGSLVEGQAPSTLNDAMRQALADINIQFTKHNYCHVIRWRSINWIRNDNKF